MMFGEIDCREGLPLAVQQCKYNDMQEAMEALAAIYVKALLRLVVEHQFEVFVHPPPPVLNETRHIVVAFCGVMRAQVLRAAAQQASCGRLHWLDFFDKLVTDGGERLAPGLEFDGTHLTPSYVQHLSAQLATLP